MNYNSVLIVDDNEVDRYLLSRLIKKAQITDCIMEKFDGDEALNFLTHEYDDNISLYNGKFPPCLIFLDINMPRMDGFEFLEEFKKIREEQKGVYDTVVFMMFTSSSDPKEMDKALSYDFVKGFITKMPESEQELMGLLK